jgi:hypothetical protein
MKGSLFLQRGLFSAIIDIYYFTSIKKGGGVLLFQTDGRALARYPWTASSVVYQLRPPSLVPHNFFWRMSSERWLCDKPLSLAARLRGMSLSISGSYPSPLVGVDAIFFQSGGAFFLVNER